MATPEPTAQRPPVHAIAHAIADAALDELNTHLPAGTDPFRPLDTAWLRIGTAAYQLLRDHGYLDDPPPPCRADPHDIHTWLHSPCGVPGSENEPVADYRDLRDFDRDSGHRVENLVAEAQDAGVFGVPSHRVLVWYLMDESPDTEGFLVTVDLPNGQRRCSSWLPYLDVMPDRLVGPDAIAHTLANLSHAVDEALGRALQPDPTAPPTRTAVAFPAVDAVVRSATPPPPPPSPEQHPHAAGPHR